MTDVMISPKTRYYNAVHAFDVLTLEEERALLEKFHMSGCIQSRNTIVNTHLKLALAMATKFRYYGIDVEDLVQEGSVGLLKAVEKYDPTAGVRFAVYAAHWVRAEIMTYAMNNQQMVKTVSTKDQRKCFFNLTAYRKGVAFTPADIKLIAAELNVSEAVVAEMEQRMFNGGVISMHGVDGENGILDAHAAESADPSEIIEQMDWDDKVVEVIDGLDDRTKHIIEHRWLAENKSTLHELAAIHNVSHERVRQIERRGMDTIKSISNYAVAA